MLGIFVVLLILMISSEDFQEGYQEGLNGTKTVVNNKDLSQQVDINTLREENPSGNEIYESLELDNDRTIPPAEVADFNYSGKWWVWQDGVRMGYLQIKQDGYFFTFDYYYFEQKTGEGTGEYPRSFPPNPLKSRVFSCLQDLENLC